MTADAILITISLLCLLLGMAGCFVPTIPGPPLSYCGLLALNHTHQVHFSATFMMVTLLFVVLIQLLDYVVPVLGTKLSGGTRWGNYGSLAGTILGLFFLPWGLLMGPLAGAFIGELLGGNNVRASMRSGIGSLVGFLASTFIKLIFCITLFIYSCVKLFF
ncbi:MAG: DUF456 domain-containing protein [Bacteroidales bacterium]|nr:DUF456 domain-containing protein [Bacteroidales bacterium]